MINRVYQRLIALLKKDSGMVLLARLRRVFHPSGHFDVINLTRYTPLAKSDRRKANGSI